MARPPHRIPRSSGEPSGAIAKLVVLILGIVAVAGCIGSGSPESATAVRGGSVDDSGVAGDGSRTQAAADEALLAGNAIVVRVVDGDTIVVEFDGHSERVRLIGIDTPETKHPERPIECFGPEASARTATLLPEGTAVVLERDAELRDDFGRLLAYVYRASDGVFVNEELVAGGYADTLWIAPNGAHRDPIDAARRDARAADRGLWGACGR